ncbi:hypothetical protein CRM22_004407 [Opisthorchis felineus]|uniref:SCP domain-containing protein n=2 Tax=Opisthorchis felineus TaxID=147828 RepID=A0A4S2LWC9_OPIFE|nr:hypothetical protein CRM22_004407 [Opisthorchis felineus]
MLDTELNTQAIALHNQFREKHGSPPLVYDAKLAQTAQNWAEQLAQTKCMRHSDMDTYGENLAYKGAWENATITGEEATKSWYAQGDYHDFNESFTYETSYFSQLIWKGSKNVGFGRAVSEDGEAAYIVAHYFPKGNIRSVFSNNVPKLCSTPSANATGTPVSTPNMRYTKLETKKELKEREKAEKKARERAEKERKEREKQLKKEQKEREKQAKKDKQKSKSLSGI